MQSLQSTTLLRGGTYKVEKVLGQGSFGITYLAEHTGLNRKVAIKEFFMKELNSRGDDGSITGMSDGSLSHHYCVKFQKEAINLSRLDHPNIVRVTDSFGENGTFYYVMDYIDGQNLNDYVKSHHVDEAEAVSIIKSVADALIYMHEEKHMLHLDLKPGNVMRRNSDGHIFLIDFGLSKHYGNDGQPETSTTIGLGTAGYAPVEQGNRAKYGEFRPTIDVYALGATLYKLLTRETPPETSMLVSDGKLVENNLRAKGISDHLVKVVSESMCPDVRKRTQTIRDFKNRLDGRNAGFRATRGNVSNEIVVGVDKEETVLPSSGMPKKVQSVKAYVGRCALYVGCTIVCGFALYEPCRNLIAQVVALVKPDSVEVVDSVVVDSVEASIDSRNEASKASEIPQPYVGTDIGEMIKEFLVQSNNGENGVDFGLFCSNSSLRQKEDNGDQYDEYEEYGAYSAIYRGKLSIEGITLSNSSTRECDIYLKGPHVGAMMMIVSVGSFDDNYEAEIRNTIVNALSGRKLETYDKYPVRDNYYRLENGYLLIRIDCAASAEYMTIYVAGANSDLQEIIKNDKALEY